jgi:phospholipid-transporting ATPase
MSVIIGCPDKTVKLFVKGAYNLMFRVIERTLNSDVVQATGKHLHSYSYLRLQTLVIGVKELSQEEFQEWQMSYEKASKALLGRGNLLRGVAANIERNLRLLGASGIEDKLQDGVPEAIEKLRQAGIKVWVLTGDKQETAILILLLPFPSINPVSSNLNVALPIFKSEDTVTSSVPLLQSLL